MYYNVCNYQIKYLFNKFIKKIKKILAKYISFFYQLILLIEDNIKKQIIIKIINKIQMLFNIQFFTQQYQNIYIYIFIYIYIYICQQIIYYNLVNQILVIYYSLQQQNNKLKQKFSIIFYLDIQIQNYQLKQYDLINTISQICINNMYTFFLQDCQTILFKKQKPMSNYINRKLVQKNYLFLYINLKVLNLHYQILIKYYNLEYKKIIQNIQQQQQQQQQQYQQLRLLKQQQQVRIFFIQYRSPKIFGIIHKLYNLPFVFEQINNKNKSQSKQITMKINHKQNKKIKKQQKQQQKQQKQQKYKQQQYNKNNIIIIIIIIIIYNNNNNIYKKYQQIIQNFFIIIVFLIYFIILN
ncbi:hypothetical protein IMG5_066340 [Ichthyophthirius multifiliis]|uniref:Transmembrane protein n=1 Tax=Ichthyophthirius multifiliis TaxID=5932 RepID=G0QPC3_ICHMU|nr:hypothetical protein IMG5_066340 [Ichthyophthirius multifiliis]EGR32932.1 hypothetical protein IMG5_066340 [Ichthyophthirius multifiliis]|eukprot:XP_004036918.1 hypothetical protein IMG5_066340 [Ichthyophthirius multifiliis]